MAITHEPQRLALFEDVLEEKFKIKIDSKGKKTKRKVAQKGFKIVGGKQVKISSQEKLSRSKGARRGAKKRVGKKAATARKSAKAMKRRKERGI